MQFPPRRHFQEERLALLQAEQRKLRKQLDAETYRALLVLQDKRAAREAGEEWEGRP